MTPERKIIEFSGFSEVNSSIHPSGIKENVLHWACNIDLRQGVAAGRGGYRLVATTKGKRLQGGCIFKPKNSKSKLVVAIDGIIYCVERDGTMRALEGITMNPSAEFIEFESCPASVKTNLDTGLIEIIDPSNILIIQDGSSSAAMWDGVVSRHLSSGTPKFETPTGLWMKWIDSRLFVSNGRKIIASDIGNPIGFTEEIYLAERSSFLLPSDCMGLAAASSGGGLLAFCRGDVVSLSTDILERTRWASTPQFQRTILPNVGCVAGRSVITSSGGTYWLSESGVTNLDVARSQNQSSVILPIDREMERCKSANSGRMAAACAYAHDNRIGFAVPSGSRRNSQIMACDLASIYNPGKESWSGAWHGIRPDFFCSGELWGRDSRLICGSTGEIPKDGGNIHIWEMFSGAEFDDSRPIYSQLETSLATFGGRPFRFLNAKLQFCGIRGKVKVRVSFGGESGPWKQVLNKTIRAKLGIKKEIQLTKRTLRKKHKHQSRVLETSEASGDTECTAETLHGAGRGSIRGIQFLVQWSGVAALRSISATVELLEDKQVGGCEKSETIETEIYSGGESA